MAYVDTQKMCRDCFYKFKDTDEFPCDACDGTSKFVHHESFKGIQLHNRRHTDKQNDDKVCSPKHYTKGKYEVIDVIEDWDLNFRLANTIKYIARHKHKGNPHEDLKKALWYLQREISKYSDDEKEYAYGTDT